MSTDLFIRNLGLNEGAIPMKLVDKNPFVTIEITDATDNPITAEGYNLTVSKQGVNIQASSAAGAFYGLQTLAQLARNGKKLPVTTIKDEPRFPYRGLHLDVSRHFFNTDYVKKQIDLVATYKINRLHWHLTDGAGWRLEIPGYPRLTEFAAWRKAANLQDWGKYDHHFCEKDEEGAYGGSVLVVNELAPRIWIFIPAPGAPSDWDTFTPAILPCKP